MKFRCGQYHTLVQRLRVAPQALTFVTGSRQTGKTTLIQQALPDVGMPWRYEPVDKPEPFTRPMLPNAGVEPMPINGLASGSSRCGSGPLAGYRSQPARLRGRRAFQ